jgi:conjugal transfer pilus assembly protein TraV
MPPLGYFSPRDLATPNSGDPIRMAPLVLRVWIAPWEDTDGDLHDQHYLYTVVHQGKWLIETNQQQIRDAYKPVFPLRGKDKPEEERPVADDAMPGVSGQRGGNP